MMVDHYNQERPVFKRHSTSDSEKCSLILYGRFCFTLLPGQPILTVELRLSMLNLRFRLSSRRRNLHLLRSGATIWTLVRTCEGPISSGLKRTISWCGSLQRLPTNLVKKESPAAHSLVMMSNVASVRTSAPSGFLSGSPVAVEGFPSGFPPGFPSPSASCRPSIASISAVPSSMGSCAGSWTVCAMWSGRKRAFSW
jgi:hypothetical protein